MTNDNSNLIIDQQNMNGTKEELEKQGNVWQGQAGIEDHRKMMLLQHVKDLKENNQSMISRLFLPREDKEMLKLYGRKQLEGAEIVLETQNRALDAICNAQLKFIKEVCNTLLRTGRGGMQAAAAAIFKENALAMQATMTKYSYEFYTLVENKYADANNRLPFIQKQVMEEIEIMMQKWKQDYVQIQNDFSAILMEKV